MWWFYAHQLLIVSGTTWKWLLCITAMSKRILYIAFTVIWRCKQVGRHTLRSRSMATAEEEMESLVHKCISVNEQKSIIWSFCLPVLLLKLCLCLSELKLYVVKWWRNDFRSAVSFSKMYWCSIYTYGLSYWLPYRSTKFPTYLCIATCAPTSTVTSNWTRGSLSQI